MRVEFSDYLNFPDLICIWIIRLFNFSMNFWSFRLKGKRRRETRKGKEGEPYLQAFYEERKVDFESSKANNSEWEKVKC